MKKQTLLLFVLAGLFLFGCVPATFAQGGGLANAQLNGTVTDPSGGAIAGAAINLQNTATSLSYSAKSDERGFYAIPNLPPGTYELKATFTGFANFVQTGIVLTVGGVFTVNVGMQVASAGEKVVVTGEAPMIEPTKTQISQVVGPSQIESLPISNRLFTDFALLTPGVATSRTSLGTTFTEYEATQISFGGMRSFSNEITVNGADFINTASGIQRSTPPQDSIQEFLVVNNSFGTEYGRAVGGIVNIVTKAGTNDLHGTVYEYFQNQALDSRNLLQKPEPHLQSSYVPDGLRQNIFGAALGGPIKQNKMFFFLNYEGKRRGQSPLFPPDLVNNIQAIDQAKALLGLAPEGCLAGLTACLPNLAGNPANITRAQALSFLKPVLTTDNDNYGFGRFDYQINNNNHLTAFYNFEGTSDEGKLVGQTLDGGGIGTPSGGRYLNIADQAVVGTLATSFSPNLVNTLLGQYARRHYNFPGMTGQPDLSLVNDLELGHNFGTNDRLYETRMEVSDALSWVKGNHVVKVGFDGNLLWSLENFPGFMPTRIQMPGVSCLADFSTFYAGAYTPAVPIPGPVSAAAASCPVPQNDGVVFIYAGIEVPASPTFQSGPPLVGVGGAYGPLNTTTWANAFPPALFNTFTKQINHGYWALFAGDQWRVTPKLTVNYGLRWEYESGLSEYVQPDYAGFQPRIGLAYSPDSKTVIRAGFGMFDDRYNLTFFFVPNTQKVVPGILCNPPIPQCGSIIGMPGTPVTSQALPMVNAQQAYQGYQIFGFPAAAGAAPFGASIINSGGYTEFGPTSTITLVGTCDTTFACGVGAGGMAHNVSKIPYAEQASLQIARQFGRGFTVDAAYLFVGAHKLVRGNNINVPCPLGTTDAAQKANPTDPGPWPIAPIFPDWVPGLLNANGTFSQCASGTPVLGTGPLAGLGPWFAGAGANAGLQTMSAGLLDYNNGVANANYNGLTVTAIERIQNFQLTANYTYSHGLDNGNFTTFINLPPNQFNYKSEYGNSNQDVRNLFVANFAANGPQDTFVRQFTLSSIITLQSGRPFTIFAGQDVLNDVAGLSTDRVGGAPVVGSCPSTATCATMIKRNTYVGDPLYSWDLHIGRYFNLTERLKLDLSADAFNLLNRSNIDEVTSVYGSPVFCGGVIPHKYNDATSRAIQAGSASQACPVGNGLVIPGVGSFTSTPITEQAGFVNESCTGAGMNPNPLENIGTQCLFIPVTPSASAGDNFGLPRTMFNPRQFQLVARFSF
ncbi:MAG TPA: TonB-dependent receptor [Candidatus Acidoferrales bacterium]|nr:TonB-dependent receptor [Candidatus Acidoferrales bacterium]